MKYSVVKQFSNVAIDNAYSFIFKIVDFGKILSLVFWAFVDIWAAFFGIFYNFFMYIYYLFLFVIDRGSETTGPSILGAKKSPNLSKIPSISYEKTSSGMRSLTKQASAPSANEVKPKPVTIAAPKAPAPAVAKTTGTTQSTPAAVKTPEKQSTAQASGTLVPLKMSTSTKGKKSFFKSITEFIVEYFGAVKNIIVKPFKLIIGLFAKKLQPVKESDAKNAESSKGGSLIDQYMKEYEKQKRR